MKKAKKTLTIIINVLIWLFVIFAVCVTVLVIAAQSSADGVPSIGGRCAINILTDSMAPTFKTGDILIGDMLTEAEKQELKVNDVITFYADLNGDGTREMNSHRIIGIIQDTAGEFVVGYETKGDNQETNMVADREPVLWQNVVCRWTGDKIPVAGRVLGSLQSSRTNFFLWIVLPLLLFFLYELYRFIAAVIKVKNTGKRQITAADEEVIRQRAVEEYLRQKTQTAGEGNQTAGLSGDRSFDEKSTGEEPSEAIPPKTESVDENK